MKLKRGSQVSIVCLGDSITYGYKVSNKSQVEEPYPQVLEASLNSYEITTRVINSGKPGWRSKQALNHINELVIKYNPNFCIIMLGINDARGSMCGITYSKERYVKNIFQIVDILIQNNITPIVLTPTKTTNKRVDRFTDHLLNSLLNKDIEYIDMQSSMNEKMSKIKTKNLLPDGIHLADQYYKIIAQIIIEKILKITD